MRTLVAPVTAFAFAALITFAGLVLLGAPPLVATLVIMPVAIMVASTLGWRPRVDTVALAVVVILLASISLATAQDASSSVPIVTDTVVAVPWGDWLASILADAAGVLAVVIMAVVTRFLPASLKAWLTAQRTAQVEQLLERALGYAATKIAASVRGQVLTLDARNRLVADALRYAVEHGPEKLVDWMGGAKGIEEKILARLPTSPSVKAVAMPPAASTP